MNRLESGNMWHELSRQFATKYHGQPFVYRYRNGFDLGKLNASELNRYIMVYTATMNARGYKMGMGSYEFYKTELLRGN
jgi:hypothetical protein